MKMYVHGGVLLGNTHNAVQHDSGAKGKKKARGAGWRGIRVGEMGNICKSVNNKKSFKNYVHTHTKVKRKNTMILAVLDWLKQPYFEMTHHAKRKCGVI